MNWMFDNAQKDYPKQLRQLLDQDGALALPGVYNPLTAIIARDVGFQALYFSGAAFSASLGIPDIGLFTLDQIETAVRMVVKASKLPLIVDADTGFGEPLNVVRTIQDLESTGVAAIQIEDQVMPKRCGHLDGKTVVSAESFVRKLKAASWARHNALIVARTDSKAVYGMDEAIRRGRTYLDAGADIIFPEALESRDEFRTYANNVDGPLLANMTEFGKTPCISVDELSFLGYKLVIFPVTTLRIAAKATEMALKEIRALGTQSGLIGKMQTRAELYKLIDYELYSQTDESFKSN